MQPDIGLSSDSFEYHCHYDKSHHSDLQKNRKIREADPNRLETVTHTLEEKGLGVIKVIEDRTLDTLVGWVGSGQNFCVLKHRIDGPVGSGTMVQP